MLYIRKLVSKYNTFSHWKRISFTARFELMSFITEHFHDVVIVIRILLVFFLNPNKSLEFLTLGEDNQRTPLPFPKN